MKHCRRFYALVGSFCFVLGLAACVPAAASTLVVTEPAAAPPTETPSLSPATLPPTDTPTVEMTPVSTARPSRAAVPTLSPTPCAPDLCIIPNPFSLARPIAPPGRDQIDFTYRFGSTQGGLREPHHGVEFLNSTGTPVQAAADGLVVVAGDDRKIFYGPYSYFYGNLIVLQHDLPGIAQPVYTLYGHLSQILVEAGEQVKVGQRIGLVGMTGVATGSHLHFEVRLGENSYSQSRNPELWLAPHVDENGQLNGALAGRIVDKNGLRLDIPNIVIEHLPAPDQPADLQIYTGTYQEQDLLDQPPWNESFAAGDLPAGWYRIEFVQYGMQERIVQVLPGQLTLVTFNLGQ